MLATIALGSVAPSPALAEPAAAPADAIIPAPRHQRGTLAGIFRLNVAFPVQTQALCPEGAACILGRGGGFGAAMQFRWSGGLHLAVSYDAWLTEGGGVYVPTSLQFIQTHIGYILPTSGPVHPFLQLGGGMHFVGERLHQAALGASLDVVLGVEAELHANYAVSLALGTRWLSSETFVTDADGVVRGGSLPLTAAVYVSLGLVLLQRVH